MGRCCKNSGAKIEKREMELVGQLRTPSFQYSLERTIEVSPIRGNVFQITVPEGEIICHRGEIKLHSHFDDVYVQEDPIAADDGTPPPTGAPVPSGELDVDCYSS